MRVVVVDPFLVTASSHHLNFNLAIHRECAARGLPTLHVLNAECDPAVVADLPHRRLVPFVAHAPQSTDPLTFRLDTFLAQADGIEGALTDLPRDALGDGDVVIAIVEIPSVLFGLLRWWSGVPVDRRPRVVGLFTMFSGLDATAPLALSRNPTWAAHARMHRFVGRQMAALNPPFDLIAPEDAAPDFAFLLQRPIEIMPLNVLIDPATVNPLAEAFERSNAPPVAGYFGEGRRDKGYLDLPDIVEGALAGHPTLRFDLHVSSVGDTPDLIATTARLRALAARSDRVTLAEGYAAHAVYQAAMARCDFMLSPYWDALYARMPSGVFAEAMALGRSAVAPHGTWLARRIDEFGVGAVYDSTTPGAAVAATVELAWRVAESRAAAPALRARWRRVHGIGPLIDRIVPPQ